MDKWKNQLEKVKKRCETLGLAPQLQRSMSCTERVEGVIVRFMTWNVLAQGLIGGPDNLVNCPRDAVKKETRFLRIVHEILKLRPTVVCLQEVDMFDYLTEELGAAGYSGHFNPKPMSPCLKFKENIGPDGCAIFYRNEELEVMEVNNIGLQKDNQPTNQQAVVSKFRFIHTPDITFVAATTHLKAKPDMDELRSEQGSCLEAYIKEKYPSEPILVCGDFNAVPAEKVCDDFRKSSLGFSSAYTYQSSSGEEPPYTFWTVTGSSGELCKTVDYIWYTKKSLSPVALCTIPSEKDIGDTRLPSDRYPSDHVSLITDFVFN